MIEPGNQKTHAIRTGFLLTNAVPIDMSFRALFNGTPLTTKSNCNYICTALPRVVSLYLCFSVFFCFFAQACTIRRGDTALALRGPRLHGGTSRYRIIKPTTIGLGLESLPLVLDARHCGTQAHCCLMFVGITYRTCIECKIADLPDLFTVS